MFRKIIVLTMTTALMATTAIAEDTAPAASEDLGAFDAAQTSETDQNFGAMISEATKKYRAGELDIAPYKNFGQWVSNQKRKNKKDHGRSDQMRADRNPADNSGRPDSAGGGSNRPTRPPKSPRGGGGTDSGGGSTGGDTGGGTVGNVIGI